MEKTGYKGYVLVEGDRAGSYPLISPSGVRIALFGYTLGTTSPRIMPLVDGLDCGEDHKTEEQAIKHIVRQYELLTTTRMERFRIHLSQAFAHGAWSAIAAVAATIAAVMGMLNFFKEQPPPPLPPPLAPVVSPVENDTSPDTNPAVQPNPENDGVSQTEFPAGGIQQTPHEGR